MRYYYHVWATIFVLVAVSVVFAIAFGGYGIYKNITQPQKAHTLIFISRQGMVAIPGYSTEQSCLGTVNDINSNPDLRSYCVGID